MVKIRAVRPRAVFALFPQRVAVDTLAHQGACLLPMVPADGTGSGLEGEQELSAWPGGQAMTQEWASELLTCQGLF